MSEFCRSCGAEILWARTGSGRSMPVDVKPVEGGNVQLRYEKHGLTAVVAPEAPGVKYVSHFSTCPEAAAWRKASA